MYTKIPTIQGIFYIRNDCLKLALKSAKLSDDNGHWYSARVLMQYADLATSANGAHVTKMRFPAETVFDAATTGFAAGNLSKLELQNVGV